MPTNNDQPRVLVVDDEPLVRATLAQALHDEGFSVAQANGPEQALELFKSQPFPVVFADAVMPGISGIGLLQKIKEADPDTQVILMAGQGSLDTAIMALRFGANEYVMKPFDNITQVADMARQSLDKLQQIRENELQIAELQRQIVQLEAANREFKELSIRDGLTGLFNHRYLLASLAVEVSRAERHGREFSVIFLDLDHFKQYNDSHGHPQGDQLLKTLGLIIRERLRTADILARYGGEEFTVILPETPKADAVKVARSIRSLIECYPFPGCETQPGGNVTASLGVASFPSDGTDSKSLLEMADKALYRAKQEGRNRVCVAGQ
ncbi:hypothetical protein DESUT3_30780 [Desulfuromonas versatilis]|uniref:diguanylate cyclase n=1 Tax=Desulfuromonas versatilis TaxID=2802975 RepID=A0ABN6E2F8_9BACT|nr:diguanylate cyclase [Desulfuromonas versatilis]BCR06009.1 hypothetical protein DESUT3_30780 [Desulfuromonas versatilis]